MLAMLGISDNLVKHFGQEISNNVRMSLQNRIQELLDEFPEKKKAHLAKFVGVSRTTPTDWTTGKTKNINGEHAYKVAEFFGGIEPYWIQTGKGPKYKAIDINTTMPGLQSDINVEPGPTVHGKVPLISWVQAGHALEVVDLLYPGEGFDWIDTTCQIRRHTYALRVSGDSMSPDFPEGCIIIVEPEMDPLPGDYVIAKNGDDEATFKQLIKDGADYYLKPLNERYPIKPIGHYRVIGVVRELVRRFR